MTAKILVSCSLTQFNYGILTFQMPLITGAGQSVTLRCRISLSISTLKHIEKIVGFFRLPLVV